MMSLYNAAESSRNVFSIVRGGRRAGPMSVFRVTYVGVTDVGAVIEMVWDKMYRDGSDKKTTKKT
jgi:hypothetical protein